MEQTPPMISKIPNIFRGIGQGENKKLKSDLGTVYDFWLLSEAEGNLIKDFRTTVSST